MNYLNKFKGSLLGLAIGDALGAPYEFKTPAEPIKNYRSGGHHKIRKGEWTDDTAMALCLANSLIKTKEINLMDQMSKYLLWYSFGYMSTRCEPVGIGRSTREAIERFIINSDPISGLEDPQKSGNGCIMRLAPVPLVYHFNTTLATKNSKVSSRTTHGSKECLECCALLGQVIASLVSGISKEEALKPTEWLEEPTEPKVIDISKATYFNDEIQKPEGAYVIDTLKTALWCFYTTDSFEDAIIKAVNIPGDRDSFGAVTGQIAGAYYGYESIPERWLIDLMGRKVIEGIATNLYDTSIEIENQIKM